MSVMHWLSVYLNGVDRGCNSMSWLDKLPLSTLLIIAIALGLAPFVPEPHLWQKLKMLQDGSLTKLIDIFDLFMHGTPAVLVMLKLYRINIMKSR